jgi:hypothetical protein
VRTRGYSIEIVPAAGCHRFALVQWLCDPGEEPRKGPVRIFDQYDEATPHIPDGLVWRDRGPRDSMYVVETWFPPEAEEVPNVAA